MTETLRLRPLVVADADVMTAVLADRSLYEFTGGEPPTREDLARRYSIQTRGRSADGSERWINSVNGYAGRAAHLLLDDLAELGVNTVGAHIPPGTRWSRTSTPPDGLS